MTKTDLIKHLRAIAEELQPLTHSLSPGGVTWDGTSYLKGEQRLPEPYALVWWSILGTITVLLEIQESALSAGQIAYLKRRLFGGMGTLNDLTFDAGPIGSSVHTINERIAQKRNILFAGLNT